MPTYRHVWQGFVLTLLMSVLALGPLSAQTPIEPIVRSVLDELLSDDPDKRMIAIERIALTSHPQAAATLLALDEERLFRLPSGEWLLFEANDSRQKPEPAESVTVNNRLRAAIEAALAFIDLSHDDVKRRLAAAKRLQDSETIAYLDAMESIGRKEQDVQVKQALMLAIANLSLQSTQAERRLDAVRVLAASDEVHARRKLQDLLRKESGQFLEPDESVRQAAKLALKQMDERLRIFEMLAAVFSGLSLGSVLLLAALGLAITYGLMGVINMAHGEFLMIGAYATYLVQGLFRQFAASWFDWYLFAALPTAFFLCALIGMALERSVLRWLYGRPLETLLSTWGVSLLLIQGCRMLFGAQNVEVENLWAVYLVLQKTRSGLFVRAVTQNRAMAACTGIATDRVDMLTFGFGCGIAGLGGVALSQIGNVGPDLGQQYVVDSFMVVVLGGVGQLAGTAIAALGLGSISKILEPVAGAVLAKITVLMFIILFIQRRPQGLFALKGRSAET
ncbi:MAG: branched-chain amino acid ABC transporter permease [Betaproteobacteria bacterium]|nr:branched-chain amino acid ABC transporter permease [Betaproteobacteria bacterium]